MRWDQRMGSMDIYEINGYMGSMDRINGQDKWLRSMDGTMDGINEQDQRIGSMDRINEQNWIEVMDKIIRIGLMSEINEWD